jgi:ribosomal-protein-serine acetyltransferase
MIADRRVTVDDELMLVPRSPADAAELFAVVERHRTSLREWLTWVDATRSAGDVRRFAQFAQSQFESRVAFDYLVRSGPVLVGAIGLHGIDWYGRSAQIGYWLSPDAVGRGIATRAASALTAHAFDALELNRIEIRCVVENLRSRAVAERLGYPFEGTLAEAYWLHGSFRDIALYATTAAHWRACGRGTS